MIMMIEGYFCLSTLFLCYKSNGMNVENENVALMIEQQMLDYLLVF